MRTTHGIWREGVVTGLLIVFLMLAAQRSSATPQAPDSADVPVVKGGAGACTADFVVTDASGKGIYNAKVEIQIRYRFGGFHRLDATVATNYLGKARFEGLPEQFKGTAEFKVTRGDLSKSLPYDPQADCHAHHEVVIGDK